MQTVRRNSGLIVSNVPTDDTIERAEATQQIVFMRFSFRNPISLTGKENSIFGMNTAVAPHLRVGNSSFMQASV